MIGDRFVSARTFGYGPCIGCYDPLPDDKRARRKIKRIIRRARRRKDNMCKKYFSLFSVFSFCLLSAGAFGEGTQSVSERQIALNLNQEILLLQLEESMKQNIEEREKIKSELNDSRESSKKSKQEIAGLRQSLKDKESEYQKKERLYNELLTSIDKSEKSRKSAETERDIWRGVAIGVTLFAVGYVVGDKAGWW